jgi:hypothetical protein
MRHVFFVFLLVLTLQARENPFFPAKGEQDIPITSNEQVKIEPLQRATITLPSTARVIEGVTIKYKTLDGAQHTKSIILDNAVDWHLPIFISQNYGSMEEKPLKIKSQFKEIASLKFIKFLHSDRELKIVTKDRMLRNFILVKPHRIVCDFKRDTEFGSYFKEAPESSKFTKVRIGTHKGYYRVVIELDGYYSYTIKKLNGSYLITLK